MPDPCNDRVMTNVRAPPLRPLSLERIFPNNCDNADMNVDLVKDYLFEGGRISVEGLHEIMARAKPLLKAEPNLVRVDGKVVIIGDIHGQYYDLIGMLRKTVGRNPDQTLLFLGDYVDRGNYGPEVALFLFCLKIKNPSKVFLLRGNHESRDMAESFNFRT